MATFRVMYEDMLQWLERKYEIELTLGEKVSLKHCLKYSQEVSVGRTLEEQVGGFQQFEAELMWLRQYGISYEDLKTFVDMPEFKEYFRRTREDCLLP